MKKPMSLTYENKTLRTRKMNSLQNIASEISGYEHYEDFSSARNDYYYECETFEEKNRFLNDHDYFSEEEVKKLIDFLDGDFDQNQRWHAFEKLGEEK